MKTSEAVERLNKDPKDSEARGALRLKLKGMTALCVRDGKIHLAETLEALEHCEETGQPAPECVSFEEWEAENTTERRACPVTGRALMKGKLRVERADLPPITLNWGAIDDKLQLLAAYRAEAQGFSDPVMAIDALQETPLPSDWKRVQCDWDDLLALKKPSASQLALIQRVKNRLIFVPRPVIAPPPITPPTPMSAKIRVVMLYAKEDKGLVAEFRQGVSSLQRSGLAIFWGVHDVPPGSDINAVMNARFGEADVCLHFLSSDYLATDLMRRVEGLYVRHIPIRLRPCLLEPSSYLMNKYAIPQSQSPVSSYPDRDSAWLEVATELRRTLQSLATK